MTIYRCKMRVRLLTLLISATLLLGTLPCLGAEKSCPPETLLNPYIGVCAPINDVRQLYTMSQKRDVSFQNIPSLTELREDNVVMRGPKTDDMPVPGGVGAGILYKNGSLQVLDSAQLHTKMFVHPNGLNPSGYLDWLFTPATNRTDSPVEVVGIYRSIQEQGSLGIYGRPCSEAYPCPNGSTVNSWQWFWLFSEFECNMTEIVDQGGHLQTIIHYANNSEKLDQEDPPLWRNRVYLWNFCTEEWDLLYEHHYRENKRDCSLENITCGWWGPILETFGEDPQPEINELGFEDTLLYHDGTWSELSPSETRFEEPVSPWILFHLDPNRGYGVGNYFAPPNAPPEASCRDVTVSTEPGLCSADASVDDGSFDPDGDPITLDQAPHGPYDLGTTDVTLTVTDDKGASDTCDATVTVVDQEAPVISSVSASPNVLWPPNHKMVSVTVAVDATDNCDSACQIDSVSSNEPVGKTAPDWRITGDLTVNLRAERSGTGNGLIYTITVRCTDQSGNSSTDTATVNVPHDMGKKKGKK